LQKDLFHSIFARLISLTKSTCNHFMNQKFTVMVVDDDDMAIKKLCQDLSTFPDMQVIATANTSQKARALIIREQPDILFLDIEMPGTSGIELLRSLQSKIHPEMKVVFYTAYNQYLLEAVRASAFDYLLKPYLPEELAAIIERYRSYVPKTPENLEQSLCRLLAQNDFFAIYTLSGLMMVNCEKIILFQYAKEQRCWQMMHIDDYKLYKLRPNTKAREILFINKAFVQISQDCIVNLHYLSSIENRSLRCIFCHPHQSIEQTASQRYFKKIREQLEII